MKISLSFLTFAVLIVSSATQLYAQFSVSSVSTVTKPAKSPGIFYSLPRTVFKINIVVEKTEKLKGPYAEFAQRMLGIDNAIKQEETLYAIKDIILSTITEPDPKAWFFVEFDERSSRDTRSLIFDLMSNGILLSLDDTPIDRSRYISHSSTTLINAPERKHFTYFAEHNLYQRVDTIVRRITIDTTVIRRNILQTAWVDRNPEQKARAAAEAIQKIRESRFKLISGFQEIDFQQIEYMDTQMRQLEEEYLSLFSGVEIKSLSEHTIFYVPESDTKGIQTIARFTEQNGLIDNINKGEPLQLVIESAGNTKDMGMAETSGRLINSLYYRIPEIAEISVLFKGKVYQRSRHEVNQLGTIAVANASRTRLNFDPNTGLPITIKRD